MWLFYRHESEFVWPFVFKAVSDVHGQNMKLILHVYRPHSQSQEVQSVRLNAASSMVPLVSMSSANNTFNKGKVSVRRPYISLWPSEDLVKDTSDRQELTPDVSVQTEPFTDADL